MGVSRNYDLQAQLGKGAQGVVFRARRRADGMACAVKQVFMRSMSRKEQVRTGLDPWIGLVILHRCSSSLTSADLSTACRTLQRTRFGFWLNSTTRTSFGPALNPDAAEERVTVALPTRSFASNAAGTSTHSCKGRRYTL